MFYKDKQKEEIEKGKEFGLLDEEIKLYAKLYFSDKQMREIRIGLEEGLGIRNVQTYAHFYYSADTMALKRQILQEKELYDERIHDKGKIVNLFLSIFAFGFLIFSTYAFFISFFRKQPSLKVEEESVEAKCGEIIDVNVYAKSDGEEIKELNNFNSKIPGTYLLCYETTNGLSKSIKSMRIKMNDNRPPEIKLKEETITVENIEDFHCLDYIDRISDNASNENMKVGCSDELDLSLEEQDVLYSAEDKYGNVGYAKLTVKIKQSENIETY